MSLPTCLVLCRSSFCLDAWCNHTGAHREEMSSTTRESTCGMIRTFNHFSTPSHLNFRHGLHIPTPVFSYHSFHPQLGPSSVLPLVMFHCTIMSSGLEGRYTRLEDRSLRITFVFIRDSSSRPIYIHQHKKNSSPFRTHTHMHSHVHVNSRRRWRSPSECQHPTKLKCWAMF
ncbi:hypothetical protein EDB19DRAFT_515242 [Suillus lakei]|nr:hypothetical protein EDB19DRAFT_515242 [Suillus lakei]